MGIESYMQEGILQAIKQVQEISGEDQIHAIGYCLGGTLLSTTMAYLKSIKKADCIKSATFLTTLLDFEKAGEMKLFIDAEQVPLMEKEMAEKGFLPASSLQRTFSLLRSNDLIWSFFVNNYLMGKDPFPFDLLYWNDDSTNMARDMHGFCLNQFYLQNHLKDKGGIHIFGTDIDLRTIDTPAYFLSTREDHIAPWEATYDGAHLFSGDVTFTLAASGHIAGVINPPAKNKYCYWTNKDLPTESQDWYDGAQYQEGSWWPHWQNWIEGQDSTKKTWIEPKNFKSKIIEPAPGRYVKVKAV
jgi:polyhydroxyalkanoate synthase